MLTSLALLVLQGSQNPSSPPTPIPPPQYVVDHNDQYGPQDQLPTFVPTMDPHDFGPPNEMPTPVGDGLYQNSFGETFALPTFQSGPTTLGAQVDPYTVDETSSPPEAPTEPPVESRKAQMRAVEVSVGVTRPFHGVKQQQVPGYEGGSGPYSRTLTKTGYYWVSTIVRLPRLNEVYNSPPPAGAGDSVYIYLGGWSGNWNSGPFADDLTVDFGLQYSRVRRVWDMSSLWYRGGYDSLGRRRPPQPITAKLSIPPDSLVELQFWLLPSNRNEALGLAPVTKLVGRIVRNGTEVYQRVFSVSSGANWNMKGTNQFLKRMASIGQNNEGSDHGTWIRNIRLCEMNNYGTYVIRADRNSSGNLTVPTGSIWPESSVPNWLNGSGPSGPVQGWYNYPYEKTSKWPNTGVVRTRSNSTIWQGTAPGHAVGINCNGNASVQ